VSAGTALVRSLNVPAVLMLRSYGLEKFHSRLKALDFSTIGESPDHYGLTLILGGAEVSLWDLCRTYAGMAGTLNHIEDYEYRYDPGEYADPSYLYGSARLPENLGQAGMLGAAAIWQCFQILTELERPTEEGSWERFSSSRTVAWKTGTSFGFRDAWAIGVTPEYLVGVWIGNADGEGRPGLTGVGVAAPLMFDAFGLLPRTDWFEPPYGELTEMAVCSRSGYRAGPDCDETEVRTVPVTGLRLASCPYHRVVHLDEEGQFRVHSDCYPTDRMQNLSWFVLPPVMEWYYRRRDPHYRSLPPFARGCEPSGEPAMALIYPRETRQIFIPRELEGGLSRVVFEVAHRDAGTTIHWHLDERYLGETRLIHQMEIQAPEGPHTLTLVDAQGNILEKSFELVGEL
jgi:penicillin-binding protein 1C